MVFIPNIGGLLGNIFTAGDDTQITGSDWANNKNLVQQSLPGFFNAYSTIKRNSAGFQYYNQSTTNNDTTVVIPRIQNLYNNSKYLNVVDTEFSYFIPPSTIKEIQESFTPPPDGIFITYPNGRVDDATRIVYFMENKKKRFITDWQTVQVMLRERNLQYSSIQIFEVMEIGLIEDGYAFETRANEWTPQHPVETGYSQLSPNDPGEQDIVEHLRAKWENKMMTIDWGNDQGIWEKVPSLMKTDIKSADDSWKYKYAEPMSPILQDNSGKTVVENKLSPSMRTRLHKDTFIMINGKYRRLPYNENTFVFNKTWNETITTDGSPIETWPNKTNYISAVKKPRLDLIPDGTRWMSTQVYATSYDPTNDVGGNTKQKKDYSGASNGWTPWSGTQYKRKNASDDVEKKTDSHGLEHLMRSTTGGGFSDDILRENAGSPANYTGVAQEIHYMAIHGSATQPSSPSNGKNATGPNRLFRKMVGKNAVGLPQTYAATSNGTHPPGVWLPYAEWLEWKPPTETPGEVTSEIVIRYDTNNILLQTAATFKTFYDIYQLYSNYNGFTHLATPFDESTSKWAQPKPTGPEDPTSNVHGGHPPSTYLMEGIGINPEGAPGYPNSSATSFDGFKMPNDTSGVMNQSLYWDPNISQILGTSIQLLPKKQLHPNTVKWTYGQDIYDQLFRNPIYKDDGRLWGYEDFEDLTLSEYQTYLDGGDPLAKPELQPYYPQGHDVYYPTTDSIQVEYNDNYGEWKISANPTGMITESELQTMFAREVVIYDSMYAWAAARGASLDSDYPGKWPLPIANAGKNIPMPSMDSVKRERAWHDQARADAIRLAQTDTSIYNGPDENPGGSAFFDGYEFDGPPLIVGNVGNSGPNVYNNLPDYLQYDTSQGIYKIHGVGATSAASDTRLDKDGNQLGGSQTYYNDSDNEIFDNSDNGES